MESPAEFLMVELTVNGEAVRNQVPARLTLSDYLRDGCQDLSAHVGCEQGVCGSCTVIVDGAPVRSCLMLAVQAHAAEVWTAGGMDNDPDFTVVAEELACRRALHCGFCTPGIAVTLTTLRKRRADENALKDHLGGHVCRCTGYQAIKEAACSAVLSHAE
jgi:aerobic carbon-monoxide dehydrogenase small subunit